MVERWSIRGRAWVFADANVNTDVLMPAMAFNRPLAEQSAMVLEAVRPGWSATVRKGDVLVVGRNFGTGSGRPVPRLLAHLGISAVVAESVSDLFYRNSVNTGLPVVECPGVLGLVSEGDTVVVDVLGSRVTNADTNTTLTATRTPPLLMELMFAGGIYARLKEKGYIA